jgi:D-tagatose-1,6-bisphosphate aldolase subunit GatZ/KbaZ
VIEAALRQAAALGKATLIEATCNQVNHLGGYTGMTPENFRDAVHALAARVGLPADEVVLGGDHLGPNPWKNLPAEEALRRSEAMVAAYVEAGFAKIHLDTSMACADDVVPLPKELIAARAARLAAVAEAAAAKRGLFPWYVIGTEVPIPGGAHEAIDGLAVTHAEAAINTVAIHRKAFDAVGVGNAFERVIALVVQPGIEFGSANVIAYVRQRAAALSAALASLPGLVFEAHSTDYQSLANLRALVEDGFAILKVGPGLTFAMREALYGLDAIGQVINPAAPSLMREMENLMVAEPGHWTGYYDGSETAQRINRHFSYSDRIRYYWPSPTAEAAVERLLTRLGAIDIPETLISQYLPRFLDRVQSGELPSRPKALVAAAITDMLRIYDAACS